MASSLMITHLSHDLQLKKSYISFVWSDDAAKRLGLEVPYGTPLDQVEQAARTAVAALSVELAGSDLSLPATS